ncbi:hypothetical protein HOY82DRAFT_574500 [Tuber indicum]|nr:hypothetical protein HOY82DRAFT_574500 [Tuber indicum]
MLGSSFKRMGISAAMVHAQSLFRFYFFCFITLCAHCSPAHPSRFFAKFSIISYSEGVVPPKLHFVSFIFSFLFYFIFYF